MRKISIIGNFDMNNNSYNGQTIKTRIVADELESLYGASEIKRVDTAGGKSVVLRLLFSCSVAWHAAVTSSSFPPRTA